RAIREIGTSTYCFDPRHLWPALSRVTPRNQQGEYYLTDVVAILRQEGRVVEAVTMEDPCEGLGVNDRRQLAELAAVMRRRILDRLMVEGVTVLDPATTYVDDTVEVGGDTVLYPGVILEGRTTIGAECVVGAGASVGTSASLVAPVTVGEGAYVGAGSVITSDVPPGALAVARAQQAIREGWVAARKQKAKKTRQGD